MDVSRNLNPLCKKCWTILTIDYDETDNIYYGICFDCNIVTVLLNYKPSVQ